MNTQAGEVAVVGAGVAYLVALGWAIGNLSYDIWGALILVPVYGVIGVAIVQRTFRGPHSLLAKAMLWGLVIKLCGTLARYWVGFEAYAGIDAGRYHDFAIDVAGAVWSGDSSFFSALPHGQGTAFVEHFTGFVYVLTGLSRLGGFVTYAFLAYIGLIFTVKAAVIAVPGLAARRYAWLCVLFPSIVYWPSSIGKEALMMLGLGLATYGIARLLTGRHWFASLLVISAGLGFSALIRPHIAGIWVAATVPAIFVAFFRRSRVPGSETRSRSASKLSLLIVLVIAVAGLSLIAAATVRYLAPPSYADEESGTDNSITLILEETTRRTSQAGSNFTPPSVSNPITWPFAVARTLTRPLPFEARGLAQLISAAEMTALLAIYVVSRRRIANLPRLILTNPYVTFAVVAIFLAGLAYTSLANLGILTRQKSLVMPFLLLLPCLPERTWVKPRETQERASEQSGAAVPEIVPTSARLPAPSTVNVVPSGATSRSREPVAIDDIWGAAT